MGTNNCTIERENDKLTLRFSPPCCIETVVIDLIRARKHGYTMMKVTCPDAAAKEETLRVLASADQDMHGMLAGPGKDFDYPASSIESTWSLLGTLSKKGRISVDDDLFAEIFAHMQNMGFGYDLNPFIRGDRVGKAVTDILGDAFAARGYHEDFRAKQVPIGIRDKATQKQIQIDRDYPAQKGVGLF